MAKRVFVVLSVWMISLHGFHFASLENNYIEIFDPRQNKVVKTVQLNPEIHAMVAGWIMNIDGMCVRLDPVTDDGYSIRIPLDPAVTVHNKWLNAVVREAYIIIPENDPPFIMIFDDDNEVSCFQFNGDINMLSQCLNFRLDPKQ